MTWFLWHWKINSKDFNFHVLYKSWFVLIDGDFGLQIWSTCGSMTGTNHQFGLHVGLLQILLYFDLGPMTGTRHWDDTTYFSILVISWVPTIELRWLLIYFEVKIIIYNSYGTLEPISHVFIVKNPNYWSIFMLRCSSN